MDFSNRTVIVTGAASGIGKATAQAFSKAGANVVLSDWHERALREAEQELPRERTHAVVADVGDAAQARHIVDEALQRFGELHVVFNNAGILVEGTLEQTSEDDWDKIFRVNVAGVFHVSKAALPHLKKYKGCIVNTASVSGIGGDKGMAAYDAVKGAVANLTRAMAIDSGRDGVRVNAVCPTFTRTGMTKEMQQDPQTLKNFIARIPLGRVGEPEDIARAVMLLASDEAGFITGVNLPVDGGVSASNGQPLFEGEG